jgi:hypothetical protein
MGVLGKFFERFERARALGRGSALEAQGKLDEAYEAYQAAALGPDAARVMLARADSEPDPARRVALLALAAAAAPASPPGQQARRRKALLSVDLLRSRPGSLLESEQKTLAFELETLSLHREAAEVYALLGDHDSQTRMLAACGAIEALESAYDAEHQHAASLRTRQQSWNEISDRIALGQRLRAVQLCEAWLVDHPSDEEFRARARSARDLVVAGPCFEALVRDEKVTIALGEVVEVGRSEGAIVLPSPVLSRKHLQISRGEDGVTVRDLQSRNGTMLAGARLAGDIAVGCGIDLRLGGQIPCRIQPEGKGVRVIIDSAQWLAPLGPLCVGALRVTQGASCVQVTGGKPVLNGLLADVPIDLGRGDEIREERGGEVVLKVLGG